MSAALSPILTNQIIDGLAAGRRHDDVADMIGCARETVTRKAKFLRAQIEARALDYFENIVPKSTDINIKCVSKAQGLYDSVPAEELSAHAPLLNQAHKIADRVLQSVGIAPSLAPSLVVQNFIQTNNTTIISPQIAALFDPQALISAQEGEVIDVDFEEMEGANE